MGVATPVNLGVNGLILTVLLHLAAERRPRGADRPAEHGARSIDPGRCASLAPRLVDRAPTGAVAIAPMLLMAAAGAFIPFAPGMLGIAAAYAVMGIGLAPLNAATQGFFMHITPVAMQGRIGALMGMVAMGLMPLAPVLAGWGLELGRPPADDAAVRSHHADGRTDRTAGAGPAPDPGRRAVGELRPRAGPGSERTTGPDER